MSNSHYVPVLSSIARLLGGDGSAKRAHVRHDCRLAARLELPAKALSLDGMVLELSRGGVLFREASRYILDRRGSPVVVHLPGLELKGAIVNVTPLGYGVRLATLMSEDAVAVILARKAAA